MPFRIVETWRFSIILAHADVATRAHESPWCANVDVENARKHVSSAYFELPKRKYSVQFCTRYCILSLRWPFCHQELKILSLYNCHFQSLTKKQYVIDQEKRRQEEEDTERQKTPPHVLPEMKRIRLDAWAQIRIRLPSAKWTRTSHLWLLNSAMRILFSLMPYQFGSAS